MMLSEWAAVTAAEPSVNIAYSYDANGLHTRKQATIGGVTTTTEYTLHGKMLTHLKQGGNNLHFFYDTASRPILLQYNGTWYHYLHNLQGDIVGIVDASGNLVVEYKYDVWGRPLSQTGSLASTLGTLNPFRYRGYVFDEETGLYYLRSRYYNPEWGRFVSTDGIVGQAGGLLTHNLYVYCWNNPVKLADDEGCWPDWGQVFTAVAIGVAAVVVGAVVVAATAATGGAAAAFVGAAVVGLKAAATSGIIVAGVSSAVTIVESTVAGDDFSTTMEKTRDAAICGFADGFMTGGVMAGASQVTGVMLSHSNGLKSVAKAVNGKARVEGVYGNPNVNGATIANVRNQAGKTIFRVDVDPLHLLHTHYGATKKAMAVHRVLGVRVGVGTGTGLSSWYRRR